MEADLGKRRSLIAGLAVLGVTAVVSITALSGALQPIGQWIHYSATATLPINDPEYMYTRALEYEQDGNSAYAAAAARRAIIVEPDYVPARKFLAAKDLKNQDYQDAALQCKGLLNKNPEDASALLGLASAYQGMGDTAKSEAVYRQVLENKVSTETVRQAAQRGLTSLGEKQSASPSPMPANI